MNRWARLLDDHVHALGADDALQGLKDKLAREYQMYTEEEGTAGRDDDAVLLPLEPNVLSHNLGVPVIVVCNKCDMSERLARDWDFHSEHFDFIQWHIRCAACMCWNPSPEAGV